MFLVTCIAVNRVVTHGIIEQIMEFPSNISGAKYWPSECIQAIQIDPHLLCVYALTLRYL